jgi:hypothetical protein
MKFSDGRMGGGTKMSMDHGYRRVTIVFNCRIKDGMGRRSICSSETRGRPEFRPTRIEFPDGNNGFFQKDSTVNREELSGSSTSKINADTKKLMHEDMDPVMKADFQEGKSTHSCCIKGK